MHIIVAIDSFKGSLSSMEAALAAKEGILAAWPEAAVVPVPIADGGEGTVDALVYGGGLRRTVSVTGPLGTPVEADYCVLPDTGTAVIEMAQAAGLPLVSEGRRNPKFTTTYGVGELIAHAMEDGIRHFVLGIGGSATHDCGVGMLQALGYRFWDSPEICALSNVQYINKHNRLPALSDCTFRVACDVTNPLLGETGAAAVFSPQKGASAKDVVFLEEAARRFAALCDPTLTSAMEPGAGAAGGLGFAFRHFLHGTLGSGIRYVMEAVGLEEKIRTADLVITGEGKIDGQTAMGKAPAGVAALAKKYGVPVVMLAGGCTGVPIIHGIPCFSVITAPMTLEEAMKKATAHRNLRETACAVAGLYGQLRG